MSEPVPATKLTKVSCMASEPNFAQFKALGKGEQAKKGKKICLIKERSSNYAPLPEERPHSPILEPPKANKHHATHNGAMAKMLTWPVSSPKLLSRHPLEQRERETKSASPGLQSGRCRSHTSPRPLRRHTPTPSPTALWGCRPSSRAGTVPKTWRATPASRDQCPWSPRLLRLS